MNCTPIVRHLQTIGGAFLLAKYTPDEKLEAVQRYLNGNDGYRSLAKILGMDPKLLHYWIKTYQYHGVEAFTKSYTNYPAAFKLDVLNYINDYGTSVRETAAIFNLSTPVLLLKWKKQMETEGMDALESKKRGRPSMKKENQKKTKRQQPKEDTVEALQEELERLRMENAYLKKLNALVQNKEKSQNKTKHK